MKTLPIFLFFIISTSQIFCQIHTSEAKQETDKGKVEEKFQVAHTDSSKNENHLNNSVEQMAKFPNGEKALHAFIDSVLVYPAIAKENGVSGEVIVQFIILKDGDIVNPKVIQGIGSGCDEEALRIVMLMPKWIPAKFLDIPLSVTYNLSVFFKE